MQQHIPICPTQADQFDFSMSGNKVMILLCYVETSKWKGENIYENIILWISVLLSSQQGHILNTEKV